LLRDRGHRERSHGSAKVEGCRGSAAVCGTAPGTAARDRSSHHTSTRGGRTAPLSHGAAGLPMVLTDVIGWLSAFRSVQRPQCTRHEFLG
jgi:hypothetical protein